MFFFFVILPPPPKSTLTDTLFPSTTLFRSVAVFDTLTAPGFLDSINARAAQLSQGQLALSSKWGMKGERGEGLLRALILDRDDGPAIVDMARDWSPEGLLLNAPHPNLLRFMPALTVPAE